MKERLGVIIVCRSSDEPLKPGNTVGHVCAFCGARLQASPTALANKVKYPDAKFTCNQCGLLYAEASRQMGILAGVEMGPLAKEYFDKAASEGNPVAAWIRKHHLGGSNG